MKNPPLRFRQVHLDFHTSGDIPHVGERFEKKQFQDALRLGHVNSVTLFSKCHHGWSYHPTCVGKMHPHLKRNLLAEQIDACREIDVRCPIYLSAGYDELVAMEHPDWVVKNRSGVTYDPLQKVGFKALRFNSPYLDYLCEQIEEVNDLWPDNDGIFLDIIAPRLDFSPGALQEMEELGLDAASDVDAADYAARVLLRYFDRATAAARSRNPANRVFHNSGHISVGARQLLAFNSHLELESLPTGGWGWDHFPLTARYAQTTGYDFLGMTGKFHTTWGEFGGFKRAAALSYECGQMLAMGAKCSIGDQLHPSGEMNLDTYALIGNAYAEVETKEPWCSKTTPVARIALFSSVRDQESLHSQDHKILPDEGASRMLLELKLPFVVLDHRASWKDYDLVILPDSCQLEKEVLDRALDFLKEGGRILASGASLLNQKQTDFVLNPGAQLVGRDAYESDYLVATDLSSNVPVRSSIIIHGGAWNARLAGGQVLARRFNPYFNRSWKQFCSHQHAPEAEASPYPGAILGTGVVWFAHDIFTCYRESGQPLYRDFVLAAIRQLLPEGTPVETSMPSGGRVALMEQKAEQRYIFHLLFATPALRGVGTEILEELIPLHEVKCSVRVPRNVEAVILVPQNEILDFATQEGAVCFTVPRVEGHQMVELRYPKC